MRWQPPRTRRHENRLTEDREDLTQKITKITEEICQRGSRLRILCDLCDLLCNFFLRSSAYPGKA